MESFLEGGVNQSSAVFSDLDLRLVLADISIVSPDFSLAPLLTDLDIHGNDKYAPIEFAGAASTVIFSVSLPPFLLLSNFCFFFFLSPSSLSFSFSIPLLFLSLSLSSSSSLSLSYRSIFLFFLFYLLLSNPFSSSFFPPCSGSI